MNGKDVRHNQPIIKDEDELNVAVKRLVRSDPSRGLEQPCTSCMAVVRDAPGKLISLSGQNLGGEDLSSYIVRNPHT